MPKGRKPDPPALKILKGKTRKGPPEPRATPAASPLPACPLPLGKAGKAEWDRFGPILLADGRLTEATAPAFALYCDAWDRYQLAAADLRSNGLLYQSESEKGLVLKANPAAAVLREAVATLRSYGAEFGLTPATRGKVGAVEPQADPLDAFLARTRKA